MLRDRDCYFFILRVLINCDSLKVFITRNVFIIRNTKNQKMFKVIETIEQNEKNFTVVPKTWESNGILFWPEHIKQCEIDKLRKNYSSSPHINWVKIRCEVKAVAETFIEGLQLEKLYSSFTDTKLEERFIEFRNTDNNKRKTKQKFDSVTKDYNIIIEEMKDSDGILDKTAKETKIMITSQDNLLFSNEHEVQEIIISQNNDIFENPGGSYIKNENEVEVLPNNVILQNNAENSTAMHVLLAIFEDIKNIKGELASLNVKVDKLLEKSSENIQENFNLNLTANTQFPLKDVPEMDALNKELFSIEFKTEMIQRLSSIGGKDKVSDGSKIMYKIVDFLFTPQLLNRYTWTGSSKTSDKKECFQKLSNIVDLIYELVFLADCRHSKYRNELYLKDKILKHTSQRLNRKRKNEDLVENN